MTRFGWDLPPGVTHSMLPGNSNADQQAEAEAEAVANALSDAGVSESALDNAVEVMLSIIDTARSKAVADCNVDNKMADEMSESVYLRKVDEGTDNECWVICAKGDPGAARFTESIYG